MNEPRTPALSALVDQMHAAARDEVRGHEAEAPSWATETSEWDVERTREHSRPCGRWVVVQAETVDDQAWPIAVLPADRGALEELTDPALAREVARDLLAAADVLEAARGLSA